MELDDLNRDQEIARVLRSTWHAFFQKWGRLTKVQRETVRPILEGMDVLVSSATASGKTESVCAPLIERYLTSYGDWTILYVSPTRALINDLYARLEGPLYELDVSLQRRTGEYRDTSRSGRRLLITTPESFDSILCRGRTRTGHELQDVRAVVLDEIHLLDGTSRGYQLQILLKRLCLLKLDLKDRSIIDDARLQCIALSATVPDYVRVMERYLGEDSRLISVAGGRRIERVSGKSGISNRTEDEIPAYLRRTEIPQKVLVFVRSRRRVDELSGDLESSLAPIHYEVRAHHGSLSKDWREKAEREVHVLERIVVVSTSTLEIGIDIGDIDLVVLDGPAPSVSSLLQRIGRGNRRTQTTRVMACFETLAEKLVHDAMLEAAEEGCLGEAEMDTHFAVLRQQIASYIKQSPSTSRAAERVHGLLDLVGVLGEGKQILDKMVEQDEVYICRGTKYCLSEFWLDKAERGSIHSNIEGVVGAMVVDDTTGKPLATDISYSGEGSLRVGGRAYGVAHIDGLTIRVRPEKGTASDSKYVTGRFRYGANWTSALRRYLQLSPDHWPVVRYGTKIFVLHLGGDTTKWVIELLRRKYSDTRGMAVSSVSISLPFSDYMDKPDWAKAPPRSLDAEIAEHISMLESQLGLPIANKQLPQMLRMQEIKSMLGVERKLRSLRNSMWIPWPDFQDCPEIEALLGSE